MTPMIPLMARAADGIGFALTLSTTYHHPFHCARLFNALAARNERPAQYGALCHTISICLSKGLGAPVGSVLLGSGELLARVIVNRLWHHHFGRGIVGTPNDLSDASTICFLTAAGVSAGSAARRSRARLTRSRSSPSTPKDA